ncbi:hypothetical protein L195_g045811, partial [Trifolium pratense]
DESNDAKLKSVGEHSHYENSLFEDGLDLENSQNQRPFSPQGSGVPSRRGKAFEGPKLVFSGPWSLDWLHDHNHGDAGFFFSARKKTKAGKSQGDGNHRDERKSLKKRQGGGMLRHSLHTLKKVARMPSKDRKEVLKVLKKNVCKRQGGSRADRSCEVVHQVSSEKNQSSASVNNDWENWVVMQDNNYMVVDDVWDIGKAIGVKFKGNSSNMFNVLSRARKSNQAGGGSKTKGCESSQ